MKKILTALLAGLVAAGSFATVSNAAIATIDEVPDGALTAYENGVVIWEGVDGFSNESYDKLFDYDETTKWCHQSPWSYVIWEVPEAVEITAYQIITANDNAEYPGRNPGSWIVYGCNDYNMNDGTGSWEVIHEVEDGTEFLEDTNYTPYTIELDAKAPAYKYYQWEIASVVGGGVFQISGFNLIYDGQAAQEVKSEEQIAAEKAAANYMSYYENAQSAYDAAMAGDYTDYEADYANHAYPASGMTAAEGSVLINGERLGTPIGWSNTTSSSRYAAFDGNGATYFDPLTTGVDWCGIDAGEEMIITNFFICPREDQLGRFSGIELQASNDPCFSLENTVTLVTIPEAATEFVYHDMSASIVADNNTGYRYFRIFNAGQALNLAEAEIYGYAKDGSNPEYGTFVFNQEEFKANLTVDTYVPFAGEAVVEETVVEETEAVVEETEAVVEETEAVVEETEAVVEETEAVVEETVVEETEAVVEETEAEVVEVVETAPVEETKAPQTFDAAIIAGVAAVISLAGYSLSKKR